MLSQTGSALTFVRWLPVPYSRNSKKTALGIGLWRYVGIGIKPNDLRKMVSRRAAMSALARAYLLHATGGLSHATLPPVAIGVPCPPLCLRCCLLTTYQQLTFLARLLLSFLGNTRKTRAQ